MKQRLRNRGKLHVGVQILGAEGKSKRWHLDESGEENPEKVLLRLLGFHN